MVRGENKMNNKPLSEEERAYAEMIIENYDSEMYFKWIELKNLKTRLDVILSAMDELRTEKMNCKRLLEGDTRCEKECLDTKESTEK